MLICRFCGGEVEADEEGVCECDCGAVFPYSEGLLGPRGATADDLDDVAAAEGSAEWDE